MGKDKVYIYPSLGNGFSMRRYFDGVISGLKSNLISYEVIRPKGNGLKAKYIDYPLLAWKKRNEEGQHLIISERFSYLVPFMNATVLVICHDMHTLYPEAQTPKIHRHLYRFFLSLMFKASKVVCVSNHTKDDLLKFMPKFFAHNSLKVVHNGIEQFWVDKERVETEDERLKDLFKYNQVLLSVGTDAWYKNNQWSLKLLADLPQDFILLRIGSYNRPNEMLIQDLDILNRITRLENLSDLDLKYCYQNAKALLFPSISEGFGWPALEAALSNCLVVSNRGGALSEFINNKDLISTGEAKEVLVNRRMHKEADLDYKVWGLQVLGLLG